MIQNAQPFIFMAYLSAVILIFGFSTYILWQRAQLRRHLFALKQELESTKSGEGEA